MRRFVFHLAACLDHPRVQAFNHWHRVLPTRRLACLGRLIADHLSISFNWPTVVPIFAGDHLCAGGELQCRGRLNGIRLGGNATAVAPMEVIATEPISHFRPAA